MKMKHVLALGLLGLIVILPQWYVYVAMRKALLGNPSRQSWFRRLIILGLLVGTNVSVMAWTVSELTLSAAIPIPRQMFLIAYYSYVGCCLGLCIYLMLVQAGLHVGFLVRARHPAGEPHGQGQSTAPGGSPGDSGSGTPRHSMGERSLSLGSSVNRSRRNFLKWSATAGLAATAGFAGKGVSEAYSEAETTVSHVSHSSLKNLSEPFTLLQISDLHFDWFFGPKQLARLVRAVNAIEADALVLTGDVFHAPYAPVENAIPLLKELIPRRRGNFFILGNHEYYVGKVRSAACLEEAGITPIGDQWISFHERGATIHLGGLDDALQEWTFEGDWHIVQELMKAAPTNPGLRLLLCHRPSILPLAARAGIDLVLAGHVHGGQCIVPFPGIEKGLSPARLFSRYSHGWYQEEGCKMYVNRGAGLIYLPWRVNCPPEIAVIRLHRPQGA